jgi:hypothetical protein
VFRDRAGQALHLDALVLVGQFDQHLVLGHDLARSRMHRLDEAVGPAP